MLVDFKETFPTVEELLRDYRPGGESGRAGSSSALVAVSDTFDSRGSLSFGRDTEESGQPALTETSIALPDDHERQQIEEPQHLTMEKEEKATSAACSDHG